MRDNVFPDNQTDEQIDKLISDSKITFMREGKFHLVFKITNTAYALMVYRVHKRVYKGTIGPVSCRYNYDKDTSGTLTKYDTPKRTARLWRQLNPGHFIRIYDQGILAPYYDNSWKKPNDEEKAWVLNEIYIQTQRVFLDIFRDNVRMHPEDNKKYVVIDPEKVMLLRTKNKNTGKNKRLRSF